MVASTKYILLATAQGKDLYCEMDPFQCPLWNMVLLRVGIIALDSVGPSNLFALRFYGFLGSDSTTGTIAVHPRAADGVGVTHVYARFAQEESDPYFPSTRGCITISLRDVLYMLQNIDMLDVSFQWNGAVWLGSHSIV